MSTIPKDIATIPRTDSDSYISLDDFLRLYSDMEDGFKYEWNNGKIEKTASINQAQISIFKKTASINQTQISIFKILSRLFSKTKVFEQEGIFISETDMKTSRHQLRRPDLAIYLSEQEEKMINGENQVAPWVGEVISPSDNINRVNKKVREYFAAGVKVVWHIFPELDEVYVYTAPDEVTICRGKRICSGKPALNGFEISAETIFAYKKQLKKKA